ncbi:cobalamin binding intrinsic factor-like [Saccostrea echinata]|uniref:cobalamin binding intrinsic factor-like n=1 Tax=Saccostrea echinata TaxID=191078 RepID=UPI002A81F2DE|nr:cobalamin binding intrinsic factor-like [Saccostrea echinata]
MAKDEEVLITKSKSSRGMEKFCLILMIIAALGLIVGLIAYLATNPPGDTSDNVQPNYPPSAEYAIDNGAKWLKDNQMTAMGWKDQQNADATLGLTLGRMTTYRPGNCDFNIMSKSLEYDLLSALMRNPAFDDIIWGRSLLAKYVIALRAACIDAKDFHGYNLIMILDKLYNKFNNFYTNRSDATAMLVLAKCVSEEEQNDAQINVLQKNDAFTSVDESSLVLLALSCVNHSMYYSTINKAEEYLMGEFVNGSFGDTYKTGLAVQALTRSNRTDVDKTIEAGLLYLAQEIQSKRQGKLLNVGEASHVLPALAKMSYADIKGKCTEIKKPGSTGMTVNVTIEVDGRAINNNSVQQTFPAVTIEKGQSLYAVLNKLQDSSSFTFKSTLTSYGRTLTEVMNLQVNLNSVQSWNVYLSGNPAQQSMYLDRIIPEDGSQYILRAEPN